MDIEAAVRDRYGAAAKECEDALCCPVEYDERLLEAIPPEVLERDYGCGDPSRHVRPGDTVLDLGSGGGKICFIAAQLVGAEGRVIGVDMNEEMLALARRAAPKVAEAIGYANVDFLHGRIQELTLEDATVDIVVSNCVLNLVRHEDKKKLLEEVFRVVKDGGRIAISDIVSDRPVPEALRQDPELWSGCVSGAFEEHDLLARLDAVGFRDVAVDQRVEKPFAVIDGIAFTSVTVTGRKGEKAASGCCC